jgi:hypothetical protein
MSTPQINPFAILCSLLNQVRSTHRAWWLITGIFFLLTVARPAAAQRIEIGASVGAMNYKGDLAPNFDYRFFRPGGGLFFRYNLSPSITFRASGLMGVITADDQLANEAFRQARNLNFQTRITEGSLVTEYNFLNYQNRRNAVNWTPYVFGGLGYMSFDPQVQSSNYSTTGWVLPFGVGVKYQIRRPWNVGLEFGTRKTFSDFLDDLGNNVTSTNKLNQGDPSLKDMYYYLGFSVSYTFYNIFCPVKP